MLFRLLEKRGNIYSSRPPNFIANELICKNETHILFTPYTAGWKTLRKAMQPPFGPRELASVQAIQYAEARQTAYDMIRTTDCYYEHIHRYTTAVILASVFGQRGEKFESPKVQALYDVQNQFTALLEAGAAPPVDGITFLKYTPEILAPWKQKAKRIRHDQRVLYSRLFHEAKERMAKGLGTGSFLERLIENQAQNGLDGEHLAYAGGVFMEGGSDTTSSTLLSFLLAMLQNPIAFKRAQEDVDRVRCMERSPNMEDLDNLPYIEACMYEVRGTLRNRLQNSHTNFLRSSAGVPSQQAESHTCSPKPTRTKIMSSPRARSSSLTRGLSDTTKANTTTPTCSIRTAG